MAIDFPASPTVGQEYTSGGMTYVYNGTGWTIKGGSTTGFVLKAGDVMTGQLGITTSGPSQIVIDKSGGGAGGSIITGRKGVGLPRWQMALGDATTETGVNNAGSDFSVSRFNDAGTNIDTPLSISRATGQVLFNGIPAAPLDALAYNGMQVNGSMDVSQEYGAALANPNYAWIVDGWTFSSSGGSLVASRQQVADAPPGFSNSLKISITTPIASLAAGDLCLVGQNIEGFRTARLALGAASAQSFTVSFWVKANRPGTYSVAIRNYNNDRCYAFPFTINASLTWEYKSATVPGDTTGVWQGATNLAGMNLLFVIAGGTAHQRPANTWVTGAGMFAVTGMTNGVAAATDTFQFTGVCVTPGTQAPTAAQSPLIMRPFDQELLVCQRYYEKNESANTGLLYSGNVTLGAGYYCNADFKTTKRASPTMIITNTSALLFAAVSGTASANTDGVSEARSATGSGQGAYSSNWIADARL